MEFSDSDILFSTLIGTFLFVFLVAFVFAAVYLYKRRQMQYVNEKIRREREFSEEILRTQLELSEQIMSSISEEIHDNVGQTLTLAKLNLNSATDADYHEHVESAKELITRSLRDLRNLSKTLNGEYILREGIQKAVERELDFINQSGELAGTFEGELDSGNLSPNTEIILYRCIQEAISNCLKHAEAKKLTISVAYRDTDLIIEVVDDGVGFDTEMAAGQGVGMSSMAKRIQLIGGKLKIDSTPGNGTRLIFTLSQKSE